MKKELRLLKKNHDYSKRGVRGERCLMANFGKATISLLTGCQCFSAESSLFHKLEIKKCTRMYIF